MTRVVCLVVLACAATAPALTLKVEPGGSMDSAGPGPYGDLATARDALRRLRVAAAPNEPLVVEVADGTYPLGGAVVFGPLDGGTAAQPVIYQAAAGARPVFSAGLRLEGITVRPDGLWQVQVPGVGPDWLPEQLYVNGRHATRARSPNSDYYYFVQPASANTRQAVVLDRADGAPLAELAPAELADANMVAYFSWETARLRPASYDPQSGLLTTTGPTPWPLMGFYNSPLRQRYHLENYRAALDEPGEWYLDRSGQMLYAPLPGEEPATTELVVPRGTAFITIAGEAQLGLTVEHLTLRGLAFRHAAYVLPAGGHSDGQAEVNIDATVMVDGARHLAFEQCEFSQLGRYAMWFRDGCQDITVRECLLDQLGAGGIKIGQPSSDLTLDSPTLTRAVTVDNCIIQNGGWLHHGAHGVWIGASPDNQITHNDIGGFNYTGVSVGWRWGYAPSVAKNNTIEFNHIHHIGFCVLSDMGGVYTLGPSEGTTVSNNVISDVNDYGYYGRGGWGLYNDEGSTGITLENNLVLRTRTGGYHLHYGKDLVIRNNIFADQREYQLQHSRNEEHHQYSFENNIIWYRRGELFDGDWSVPQIDLQNNLYWDASRRPVTFMGKSLEEWQAAGHDHGSRVADPLFANPEAGDFNLPADSPALATGFKPFDWRQAGVYGRPEWVARAAQATWPAVVYPDPPPNPAPRNFAMTFDNEAIGSAPNGATVNLGSGSAKVGIAAEPGPTGTGQSLRVDDRAGLANAYDPHFLWDPFHESGHTTFSFDLKLSTDSNMYVEWRDNNQPYRVGPTVRFTDGRLLGAGRDLAAAPGGQWLHVTMSAGLGAQQDGTWTLTVAALGGQTQTFAGLPLGNAEWRALRWLGIVSDAAVDTSFWLDNLTLENNK